MTNKLGQLSAKTKGLATSVPGAPSAPAMGLRQQRAAQLKAEMEAKNRLQEPAAPPDEDERSNSEAQAESQEDSGTGPVGTGEYVVKKGDCISSIAKNTGHFWKSIWNDAANAELRGTRIDPNILLPDDRVAIPPKKAKHEPGETEMRHRFVRRGEPSMLRLRFTNFEQPRANENYRLVLDGKDYRADMTDPDGCLEVPIPSNARRAEIFLGVDEDYHYSATWSSHEESCGPQHGKPVS